jgi:hypothetical protein
MYDISYGNVLVCMNGHVISSKVNDDKITEKYCAICGDEIINKCVECNTHFKGTPRMEGNPFEDSYSYFGNVYIRPAFCVNCGKPHSWTKRAEEAVYELIELAPLTEQEIVEWKKTVPILIKEAPTVSVAAIKFKTFAKKAGNEIGKTVKDIVVSVVSEVVKKAILQ